MYIELVRNVIEQAVALHAANTQQPQDQVLSQIKDHIEATSREYRKDEPDIRYRDPLCRLGYLYMNVPAHATLFEKVLMESDNLGRKINNASQGVLNICSLGGGPGTELLGIAKYFQQRPDLVPPRKIAFTVIDNVLEWAETWQQLADAVEEDFRSSYPQQVFAPPTINQTFLPLDVLNHSSYENYAFQFGKADIVVFNYLFSENKTRLGGAQQALESLARVTSKNCAFVVIDRLERDERFKNEVVHLFKSAFNVEVVAQTLGGKLDIDEQTSEMGQMLTATLKRTPRVKFFTDLSRHPTVF